MWVDPPEGVITQKALGKLWGWDKENLELGVGENQAFFAICSGDLKEQELSHRVGVIPT